MNPCVHTPGVTSLLAAQPAMPLPPPRTPADQSRVRAVEFETALSPVGRLCLPNNQQIKFAAALGNRVATVWADERSVHVFIDGDHVRTRPSTLTADDLHNLIQRGGRVAGPEPAAAALPSGAKAPRIVEVDRLVGRDGDVGLGGQRVTLAAHLAGQQVVLRFDGQLMHVITDGRVVKTLPAPIAPELRVKLSGARSPRTAVVPPTAQPLRAQRKVPPDGRIMVGGQKLRVGRTHFGKIVTVIVEDTIFRVMDGDVEISTHPRKSNRPIRQYRAAVHRAT